MSDLGINVEAVTIFNKVVTLYSISPFEHSDKDDECYVTAVTTNRTFVRIGVVEAKRVRRTANKSCEHDNGG